MEIQTPRPLVSPDQEGTKDPVARPVGSHGSNAPTYTIPPRKLGAVEHPMVIKDLEKAVETFGQTHSFKQALYSPSPKVSVPLYLRPDNPTLRPLTSHNATTRNIVVKITVPKRTGRKRKRGTDGPFEDAVVHQPNGGAISSTSPEGDICSQGRLDDPKVLRRKLIDNVGKYTVDPIGIIKNTHRYRGSADFQYSLGSSRFMNDFVENVLPGSIPKLRQFSFEPGVDKPPNVDLVPPPFFTPIAMPFPYFYSQNPNVRAVDDGSTAGPTSNLLSDADEYERMINTTSKAPAVGYFISCDQDSVPMGPRAEPNLDDPQLAAVMAELRQAMDERPIWTRRSMINRLGESFGHLRKSASLVRYCINYAGYQFKGGPWRDSLVRYGLDPRTDPKYRIYQTLIFKLSKTPVAGRIGKSWQSSRRTEAALTGGKKTWSRKGAGVASRKTHEFDGTQFSTDGKVWQVCDITDPLLARLFAESDVLPTCDLDGGGFYPNAVWATAKGIMKRKMLAIRFGRALDDADFDPALAACWDICRNGGSAGSFSIPLPELNLTAEERSQISRRKIKGSRRRRNRDINNVRADYSTISVKMRRKEKEKEKKEKPAATLPAGGKSEGSSLGAALRGSRPEGVRNLDRLPGPDDVLPGIEEDDGEEGLEEYEDEEGSLLGSDEDDDEAESGEDSEIDEDEDDEDEEEEGDEDEEGGDEDEDEDEEDAAGSGDDNVIVVGGYNREDGSNNSPSSGVDDEGGENGESGEEEEDELEESQESDSAGEGRGRKI